jgi:hypothetical protein
MVPVTYGLPLVSTAIPVPFEALPARYREAAITPLELILATKASVPRLYELPPLKAIGKFDEPVEPVI